MTGLIREADNPAMFELDSAGTGAWHAGELPDRRAVAAGHTRGIVLEGKARAFLLEDFDAFDWVVAMDGENLKNLQSLLGGRPFSGVLCRLRDYDPQGPGDVPDPYYGDGDGFQRVLDICERSCAGLLRACVS